MHVRVESLQQRLIIEIAFVCVCLCVCSAALGENRTRRLSLLKWQSPCDCNFCDICALSQKGLLHIHLPRLKALRNIHTFT